jgi:glycosyltransferase involved in cell wall biosynthesis
MKRVLFLAYFFPPEGGAGVQRAVKFCRYLPELGWQPVVVTQRADDRDGRLVDDTLARELPPEVEVIRVASPPPPPPTRWRGRADRWLRLEREHARWWRSAAVEAGRQATDVDVVLATMSPFESALAAEDLARFHRVPWVADLRDPWALDEMFQYPSGLHRRLAMREMGRTLAPAAAVIMNTPEAAAAARAELPHLRRVEAIPNGFDEADFEGQPPPARDDGAFRIVHTGHLLTSIGRENRRTMLVRRLLGGSLGRVDILTRSHVFLMRALDLLLERDPSLRSTIELHLAGNLTSEDVEIARNDVVHLHGYLAHDESVALLRGADLLFLPMQDVEPGRRSRMVPGKTYEYLASGRPILAALPDGDARDLVQAAGTGLVCRPADSEAMARIIREQVDARRRGEPPPAVDRDLVASYGRRPLTARLARLLDDVTGRAAD